MDPKNNVTMNSNAVQNTVENSEPCSFYKPSAYTVLNTSEARAISSYYLSQPYSLHRPIPAGTRSCNYCIVTEDQSCYLCKICNERTKEDVWLQIKALITLQSYGLPLAYPLKRHHNTDDDITKRKKNDNQLLMTDYILQISSVGSPIVMYEWKQSRPGTFASASSSSYTSSGTALAQIHSVDYRAFVYLPSFPFGMARMLPIYFEELPKLSDSLQQHPFVPVLQRELRRICHTLYKKTPYEVYRDRDYIVTNVSCEENSDDRRELLPLGILHGDLFLDNMLFQPNGELDAIVDWEDISVGERLIDVTMFIVGSCFDSNDELSVSRAIAFLTAYQDILHLTADERKYFETFLRYSFLSIACFRWHRFNVLTTSEDRCNSYMSMLKRMDSVNSEVIDLLLSA